VGFKDEDVSRVVMLIVGGASTDKVLGFCTRQFGMTQEVAENVLSEARKKLTLAADFARDEQLGTAITRLNDIYVKACNDKDIKTALQAQRELNKLMNLYGPAGGSSDGDGEDSGELRRKIDLIEGYILPLKLTDERYPIEEHVRVAAELVREQKIQEGCVRSQ
jgi:hypothetical protein